MTGKTFGENESPLGALERDMRVTFNSEELNGFFQELEPIDLNELWRVIDTEDAA